MFSINAFHPFIDGCKRTSLLATYFFLLFNGIQFDITYDMIDLTIKIADRKILDEAIVSARLRPHCRKNLVLSIYSKTIFPLIHTDIHKNENLLALFIIPLMDSTRKIWPRA
jgi:fido (protein-threonine AMPylation protein)